MNRNDLPSRDYIARVMRFARPLPEPQLVDRKPHPLKGKPKAPDVTPDEIHRIRSMKLRGMLNKEIAVAVGRSYTAVQKVVTDITKATRNEADKKRAIIRSLRERGATWREIGEMTGASKRAISWAIKKPKRAAGRVA